LAGGGVETSGPDARPGLELIVRDLARALDAEMALLAVAGPAPDEMEVLAAWGAAPAPMGVVARVLQSRQAVIEAIELDPGGLDPHAAAAAITHVVAAPVRAPAGPTGVLCAGLASGSVPDLTMTLWLAKSYARLASLCLQDPGALDGLLAGGGHDALTGCLTQAALVHELGREIARAERDERPFSCCFIDLDHFRRVNDGYGHLHGSRVLASVGEILRAAVRTADTVGRYGGDEFVVLLPGTDEATALELAAHVRATIARTMINLPHDPLDASIGVAEWHPGATPEALLGAADEALLAAKAAGGATAVGASGLSTGTVTVKDVLDVGAQFDESGGASVELTAWELDTQVVRVMPAWSRAIKHGLLEPVGKDPLTGEEMWRLSDEGRQALECPAT
jgi:diguanylate cyclase (GGDEF)-like protein